MSDKINDGTPSAGQIQRLDPVTCDDLQGFGACMAPHPIGDYVSYSDHLAAIAAAEQRGRAKGIEEAALVCLDERELHRLSDDPCRMDAAGYFYNRIRALVRGGLMIDQAEAMDERNIALQRGEEATRNGDSK